MNNVKKLYDVIDKIPHKKASVPSFLALSLSIVFYVNKVFPGLFYKHMRDPGYQGNYRSNLVTPSLATISVRFLSQQTKKTKKLRYIFTFEFVKKNYRMTMFFSSSAEKNEQTEKRS